MSWLTSLFEFVFDRKKIHQVIFILPLIMFYLTGKPFWLLLVSVIILAVMEVYKADLENKIRVIITNRIKQKSKNKSLIRNWKDQLIDAKKEFSYIFAWWFFGIVSILFIAEFVYSAILSYNYNKLLFLLHMFLIVYILFLDAIINHNFDMMVKNRMRRR